MQTGPATTIDHNRGVKGIPEGMRRDFSAQILRCPIQNCQTKE